MALSNPAWTIPLTASHTKHLVKEDKPIPTPGSNQVLVKLTATSLNFRDFLIAARSPEYPGNHKADLVPGADGAGIIHSTGPDSSWGGREGTPVILHPSIWMSGDIRNHRGDRILGGTDIDGTLQSWIVIEDERAIEAPKGLSPAEQATLITAGGTAFAAIRNALDGRLDGTLEPWKGAWTEKRLNGQTVLTQGTGGVSCFAIQIASALGATVIATSSSDAKLEIAKSLGATHLINYIKTTDWDQEVLRITGGKGVDHIVEVGGAKTLVQSVVATRPGGLISVIGILTGPEKISESFVSNVLFGAKIIKGCTAFSRETMAEFVKFVDAHGIKPVVAANYGFDQAIEAFAALEKQNAVGKIAITISDP